MKSMKRSPRDGMWTTYVDMAAPAAGAKLAASLAPDTFHTYERKPFLRGVPGVYGCRVCGRNRADRFHHGSKPGYAGTTIASGHCRDCGTDISYAAKRCASCNRKGQQRAWNRDAAITKARHEAQP